jgi:hypothetical protein
MKCALLTAFLILAIDSKCFPRADLARQTRNNGFCGTYPGRVAREQARSRDLRRVAESREKRQALTLAANATEDRGQIAVIEDDGSIVFPQNPFDLPAATLRLTPEGASGSYRLTQRQETIGSNFGTQVVLADDDTHQIPFPANFQFPFFGATQTSVFVNSDGNITFGAGDSASIDRDLSRFNSGPPRIGAFFADLDPSAGRGAVYYNPLPDRLVITWSRVREYQGIAESSFQIVLFPDGAFELVYGGVSAQSGIAGWSGGGNLQTIEIVDLSASVGMLWAGPKAERFSRSVEIDLEALSNRFYQTHSDDFDQLVMFTNFAFDLDGAFAFELLLKNEIRGIGQPQVDFSSRYGSKGQLQSFLAMNQLSQFPDDPDTVFFGTNSTINILGQESGHRWLAYVRFRDRTGRNNTSLLGRDEAHWSFFFNSDASVMEGNQISDLGEGNFHTVAATDRYSRLDQYIMGLRDASQVGPLFYVSGISGTSRVASSSPAIGVTFQGAREDLSVEDIIAAEGPRIPSVVVAPKVFRQAFILLVQRGTTPSSAEVAKIDRIRQRWQEFFFQATDGLGTADTALTSVPITPTVSGLSPASGPTTGNTPIYISGSNFQPGVSIMLGSRPAVNVQRLNSSLLTAIAPAGDEGIVSITVANPGALPATLENAYTYLNLNPAAVFPNALRLAFAVDTLIFRSNLGINNPGSTPAEVRVLHIERNGLLINEQNSITVPANGFVQRNSILRELEGTTAIVGREGSLVLESSQPIQAFISQIDNQTGDPSIIEGFRQGSMRLILQSAANTGPFRSSLLVLNLSPIAANVSITAFNRDSGQPQGSAIQNLSIPANGYVSYDNILASLNVNNAFGPVEIRSTNGTLLAAISRVSGVNAGTSGFFPALQADQGAVTEIIPWVIDNNAFRTNLGLNNFGTVAASVNASLFGTDGSLLASTSSPISVPSQGMVQINNVLRFLLAGSSNAAVTNRQGYLRLASNVPIKAFATQINNVTNDPSIENSVSSGSANLLLKAAANLGFRSTLAIVNPNSTAVTVEITAREGNTINNGAVTGSRTVTIPSNGQFVSENILQEIGATSLFGPVEIRSTTGVPVIAVSRVQSSAGNTSGFFTAQPLPQ